VDVFSQIKNKKKGCGLEGRVPMRAGTLGEMYLSLLKTLSTMAITKNRSNPV
jgi:hypothetical protein